MLLSLQCMKLARNSGFARYFPLRETYLNPVSCSAILLHTKYMLKIQNPGHSEETESSQNFEFCLFARGVVYLCCNSSIARLSNSRQFREILTTGYLLLSPYLGQYGICSVIIYSSKHVFLKVASVFLCSGMNKLLFIPRK